MSRKQQILELCDKVQRDLKLAGLPIDGCATDGTEHSSIKSMWSLELGFLPTTKTQPPTDREEAQEAGAGQEKETEGSLTAEPTSAVTTSGNGVCGGIGGGGSSGGGGGGGGGGAVRWYERAYDYWEDSANCPVDEDGVLGGYGHISPTDIAGSSAFLDELKIMRPSLGDENAADCGAGIGRVTKHLLLDRFDTVDVVEQSPRLIQAAPKYVGRHRDRTTCVCLGLQDFFPAEDTYDLVWIQWVVGHFTDVDFLKVLKRCRGALREGGVVVVKDNVVAEGDGAFKVDSEDSSMTRSLAYFRSLFNHAGVRVVHQAQQDDFPGELFPVYMFALE